MTRAWALLLLTIGLAVADFQLIDIRTDVGDFFYSGKAGDAGILAGQLQSDDLARRYLVSIAHPDMESTTASKFVASFQSLLAQSDQVQRVWNEPFNQAEMVRLLRFYAPYQLRLLSLQPGPDVEHLFSPEGMSAQAETIKQALLGSEPSLIKSILKDDPMLLVLPWFARAGEAYHQPDTDPEHSSFFLETRSSGLDTPAQQELQQWLSSSFDALNTGHGERFTLEYTGVPVFAVQIKGQIKQDITRISIVSVVLITLLAWLVFRSVRALLGISVMLGTTVCIAALATQLIFGYLHGLTLALGTTLLGVCIDYFVHGMVHAGNHTGETRIQAVRRIWPMLLIGGSTTLIGYIALSLSGFPGLQQVAIFTGTGIVSALLITRYFQPGFMDLLRIQVKPHINLSWLLATAASRQTRYLLVAICASILLIGGSKIHWEDNPGKLAPPLQHLVTSDQAIRARLSSIEPGRFIIVTDDSMETVLQTSETVQQQLHLLQQQGELDAYYPLFPWVASTRLQNLNAHTWNSALNPTVRERWTNTLREYGLNASAFPTLTTAPAVSLEPGEAMDSPLSTLLSRQLTTGQSGTTAVIWLGKHQPQAMVAALADIPGARYFSQKDSIQKTAAAYRHKSQMLLAWGILLILLMLGICYRSVPVALRVLSPAALSVMLILGLWGILGINPGILHLIGLLLTAAVCVDFGVFFLENRGGGRVTNFQAITLSAITTVVAFASLGAAENPALTAIAWTVGPGVLVGFLLCPVMLGDAPDGQYLISNDE